MAQGKVSLTVPIAFYDLFRQALDEYPKHGKTPSEMVERTGIVASIVDGHTGW